MLDGRPGHGKTFLMKRLRTQLACAGLDADDYVAKKTDKFVGAIRTDELRGDIERELAPADRVIISSVCAGLLIEKLSLSPAILIYVKKTSDVRYESIVSQPEIDHDAPHEGEYIKPGLHTEVENYHRTFNPRGKADALYYWPESLEF